MGSNVLTKEKVFVQNEEANSSSTVVNRTALDNSTLIDQNRTLIDQNRTDLINKISQDILESPFKENPDFNPSNFSATSTISNNESFVDSPLSDMNFTDESHFSEGLAKNKKIIIYSSVGILVLILSIIILKSLVSSPVDSNTVTTTTSNKDSKQTNSLITEEKINDTNITTSDTTSDTTSNSKVVDQTNDTNSNETISLLPEGVKKYIPDSMNQKLEELLSVLNNLTPGTTIKKHKKTVKRTIVANPNQKQGDINLAANSSAPNSSLNKKNNINSMNNSNNSSSNSTSSLTNSNNTTGATTYNTTNNTYNSYSGASNSPNSNSGSQEGSSNDYSNTSPNGSYSDPNDSYSDSDPNNEIAQENPYQEEIVDQKPRVYGTQRANKTPYTKDLPTSSQSSGVIPDNPYWNLPNRVFKDNSNIATADVNEVHKYLSNMNNAFNYQRYKTILEVKALQQKGTEKILINGSKEPKLWSRMNSIMGLADIGYELDISEVEKALNNERSTLISGFFRRYAARENVTEGELYILRQSIKVTDSEARFNILRTLSRWDNNLGDLYFVAASYDPSNKIKNYANRILKSRNLDEETLELYRNIITGNTEVDFMIDSDEGENISENTSNESSSFNG